MFYLFHGLKSLSQLLPKIKTQTLKNTYKVLLELLTAIWMETELESRSTGYSSSKLMFASSCYRSYGFTSHCHHVCIEIFKRATSMQESIKNSRQPIYTSIALHFNAALRMRRSISRIALEESLVSLKLYLNTTGFIVYWGSCMYFTANG